MWVLKVSFDAKDVFFGSLAQKHKIALFGCPISFHHQKSMLFLNINGVILGDKKNKESFISDLKKSNRILAIEKKNDFIVASYKTNNIFKWLKPTHLVHSAHLSIDFSGTEILTVESFQKNTLLFLLNFLKLKHNAKLISITQIDESVIPILRSSVSLTAKQRFAFELALKNGYYSYPRKISVKDLAKQANLAFSTFQQHLRKAESKLLPTI